MKTASAGLLTLLQSGDPFFMALLYTLTLSGGSVYRWTAADLDLVVSGNTFTSAFDLGTGQPLIKRGGIRSVRGLELDTLDVTMQTGGNTVLSGAKLPLLAANGGLDNARLRIDRLVMARWGDTSLGTIPEFEGTVAGVEPSASLVTLHVKSDPEKLSVTMPRNLYLPTCNNVFGDAGCGIVAATYTSSYSALAGSTSNSIGFTDPKTPGYYTLGRLVMTSGVNSGAKRTVKVHSSGAVSLVTPLPVAPAVGDSFTLCPTCSRTKAACAGWSNLGNFRGTPYVPQVENAR